MPNLTANLNMSVFIPILIWSMIWKGIALWNSARAGQMYWYIALLIVNTGGLLEIVYLLWFRRLPVSGDNSKSPSPRSPRRGHPSRQTK